MPALLQARDGMHAGSEHTCGCLRRCAVARTLPMATWYMSDNCRLRESVGCLANLAKSTTVNSPHWQAHFAAKQAKRTTARKDGVAAHFLLSRISAMTAAASCRTGSSICRRRSCPSGSSSSARLPEAAMPLLRQTRPIQSADQISKRHMLGVERNNTELTAASKAVKLAYVARTRNRKAFGHHTP